MLPIKQSCVAAVLLCAFASSDAAAQADKPKDPATADKPKAPAAEPVKAPAAEPVKAPAAEPVKAPVKKPARAPVQPPAPAAETVALTPFDLIAGTILAPSGTKRADIVLGACTLTGGDKGWSFKSAACPQLAAPAKQTTLGPLTIVLADLPTLPATYALTDGAVTFKSNPTVLAIALPLNGGWSRFELANGVTKDANVVSAFGATPPDGTVAMDAAGVAHKLQLSPERPATPDTVKVSASQDCLASDNHTDAWCPKNSSTICIDVTSGISAIWFGPRNHIMIPNRSLDVVVRRRIDQVIVVSQQGKRGLYEPAVQDFTAGALAPKAGQQSAGIASVRCDVITPTSLAPRQPGSADLKVELRESQDHTKPLDDRTFELEVDTTYAGAIRLGFSTVFGRAVDRAYAAQTGPGSSTLEVASTEHGDVNIEAVVSFSTYLFDLILQGGRTYATRSVRSYLLPSPYIAVGLVTPKAGSSGLRAVPSLHLGVEWELSKSFSVGVDAVARRVTRLSDGFAIGSPVSADSILTENRYEWGWSFTFTVSPEFFQFAVGKP